MPVVNFNLAVPPVPAVPTALGGVYTNQVLAADKAFLTTLGINAASIPTDYINGTPNFVTLLTDQSLSRMGYVNLATPGLHTTSFLSGRYTIGANSVIGNATQNFQPLSAYLQMAALSKANKVAFDQLLIPRSASITTASGPFTAVTWPGKLTGGLHQWITTNHLTAWKLSAGDMIVDSLVVRNLTALDSISAKNIITDNLTANNSFILDLDVVNLSAQFGIINNLTATNLISNTATINNLTTTSIVVDHLTATNATITQNLTTFGNIFANDYFYLDGTRVGGGGGGGTGDCCTNPEFIDPVEYVNIYNLHYTDRPALTVTQFGDKPVAEFYDVSGHPERNIASIVAGGLFDGRPTFSGEGFALALDGEKSLHRWGINSEGELATGSTTSIVTPEYVPALKFKQISTKGKHTLAIGTDGKLYAWGVNTDGQLGNGQDATNTVNPNKLIVTEINSDTDWLYVSAGSRHSAAIKSDGGINNLYTWGNNLFGQLGQGTTSTSLHPGNPIPVAVSRGIVSVSCGGNHTLAIDSTGKLWSWGRNSAGQLGDASTVNKSTPQLISPGPFSSISTGNNFSAAIDATGSLLTWGENNSGQLGNRNTTNSLIPIANALAGTAIRQVSCGHQHAVAIDTIGRILTWGYNQEGELGTGFANITPNPNPQDVSTGKTFKYCTAGVNSTYGIDVDGNVWSWGANNTFQLGKSLPVTSLAALSTFTGNISSKNLALIIDGSEETPGFVGIKTQHPNCELTVEGNISASGTIFGNIQSPLIIADNIIAAESLFSNSETLTALIHNLTVDRAVFTELSALQLAAVSAVFDNLSAHRGIIDDLSVKFVSANDIFTNNLTALSLSALTLTSHSIKADELTAAEALITNNLHVSGTIFGHFAGSITSPNISADSITAKSIYAIDHIGIGTSLSSVVLSHGVDTQLYITKNAVIDGDLTVEGHTTQLNTDVNITEALRITNTGTQTCLTVQQSGGLNVAEFYYSNWPFTAQTPQVAMVICGNAHHSGSPDTYNAGFVGIKTATPNHELTVIGTISASEDIITDNGSVKARNISATTVTGDNGIFTNLTIDSLSVNTITSNNLTVNQNVSVGGTLFAGRIVGPLVSLGTIVTAIRVETDYLSAKDADINTLRTLSSFNVNLSAINISATNLTAVIANLSTANISIENVDISNITKANISSANLTTANITDATISHNLTVANLICAVDVFAEHFHGPFLITTNDLTVENLTATTALISSANISAAHIVTATIDTLFASTTVTDHITAKSLVLGNNDRTTLTIKQSSGNDLVSMYFQTWPYTTNTTAPAFFIKGNAFHNSVPPGGRDFYNAGYVGILTDDPTNPLTVNGSILSMGSNTIQGCHIVGSCDVTTPFISAAAGTIIDLTTDSIITNTLYAAGDITADSDVHVTGNIFSTGTIFGNIVGGFTNTGITVLDELEANKVTTQDLIVTRKIAVNSSPLGDSDKWTAAYYTPVTINLVLDGGGSSVTTGTKGYVEIPFNMTVTGWSLYADVSSTFKTAVSVLSSSFASYPLTTPIYLNVPTLEAGTVKNSSSILTGWSTNLQAGTVLNFGVSAVPVPGGGTTGPTAKLLTLSLKCIRR